MPPHLLFQGLPRSEPGYGEKERVVICGEQLLPSPSNTNIAAMKNCVSPHQSSFEKHHHFLREGGRRGGGSRGGQDKGGIYFFDVIITD